MNRDRPETLGILRSGNEPARESGLFRVKVLGAIARLLRVTFKVDGLPYGWSSTSSSRRHSANQRSRSSDSTNRAEGG